MWHCSLRPNVLHVCVCVLHVCVCVSGMGRGVTEGGSEGNLFLACSYTVN